jgi:hypothetical protein
MLYISYLGLTEKKKSCVKGRDIGSYDAKRRGIR